MNSRFTRRFDQLLLVALVGLSVMTVAAPRASAEESMIPPPAFEVFQYNFDKTTAPWLGAMFTDVPKGDSLDMLQPILTLGGDKDRYALISSNGADGVWMYTTFLASQQHLAFNFEVADVANGGRLAPIVYVGNQMPKTVYQFEKLGYPLEKGRQELNKYVNLKDAGLMGGKIVIAIGFLNLDRERMQQNALIDNIRILLHSGD